MMYDRDLQKQNINKALVNSSFSINKKRNGIIVKNVLIIWYKNDKLYWLLITNTPPKEAETKLNKNNGNIKLKTLGRSDQLSENIKSKIYGKIKNIEQ